MSSRNRIVPVTTKRLVSSTFGFERPLTPDAKEKNFLMAEEERHTPPEKFQRTPAKDSSWEQFKKKIRRRSLFWICSSITAGIWLLILTVIYAIHLQNADHSKLVEVIERTIEVAECTSDSECSAPTPYCDTTYSNQCSECLQSTHCTNPLKPFCDIYGSRSCHECVVNRDCSGAQVCDSSETRTCANCFVDKDCASNPTDNLCLSNNCVQCITNTDCASQLTHHTCSNNKCVQCVTDTDCSGQPVNKYCSDEGSCVRCTKNVHCASEPTNKICDLSTYTCAGPCTTAGCASDPDGKTKCCGTKCIYNCAAGYICNVFESACVPKIEGVPKGTNVPTTTTNTLNVCTHCHNTNLKITGSMFDKGMLSNIDYLTGIRYIFETTATPQNPDITGVTMYFKEAPTCSRTDFNMDGLVELGQIASVTNPKVDFDNVLPLTSDCFFVLTQGAFQKSFTCVSSRDFQYQVYYNNDGSTTNLDHTPYYELFGY